MDIKEYIASGIIETYVMGLCTREEEQEMDALRSRYPDLDDAVVKYEEEMEKNMQQHSTLPPPETDTKILKALDDLQAPVVQINSDNKRSGYNLLRIAAAAAILLFIVSAVFNFVLLKKNKEQEFALMEAKKSDTTLPLRDYAIMNDPTITPVAMYGVGIHVICRCTMFWDKKTGKMYIMIHHLPLSSSSKDYQLWAMVDGKPVSVGVIRDDIRGRFIEMAGVPADAVAFSVTLEKAGGTDTPTEAQTYLKGSI